MKGGLNNMPTEGLTADKLYELFMDKDVDFAEDLYSYFGQGSIAEKERFIKDHGMYFTPFDESALELDKRQRDLDYKKARMTSEITQEATDRAYKTEQDKLRTGVEKNLKSAKSVQGRLGLRSGSLDTTIEDTIESSGDEVKNLADKLVLSRQAEKDKYNMAMVDAALDYDQDVRDEKEAFYDRTLSQIIKLVDQGAFSTEDPSKCEDRGLVACEDGSCRQDKKDCPGYSYGEHAQDRGYVGALADRSGWGEGLVDWWNKDIKNPIKDFAEGVGNWWDDLWDDD